MYMFGKEYFDELNEVYQNPYITTTIIAKEARRRAEEADGSVSPAKALSWTLSGKKPNIVSMDEFADVRDIYSPEDLLHYISDEKIVNSARKSLEKSKELGYLVYEYEDGLSEDDISRVNVVTNLIWYKKVH